MYFNSHAHVERDHTLRLHRRCQRNFNSHAHVERDIIWQITQVRVWHFNSHAHVERDMSICQLVNFTRHFNSHAHVERDWVQKRWVRGSGVFQLTRSRGAWQHSNKNGNPWFKNFNSHAHVERDLPLPILRWIVGISTHTLTWSVTFLC